jgi:hypothetical protein
MADLVGGVLLPADEPRLIKLLGRRGVEAGSRWDTGSEAGRRSGKWSVSMGWLSAMLCLARAVCLRMATAVRMRSSKGENGLRRRELLLVEDRWAAGAGCSTPSSMLGVVEARWGLSFKPWSGDAPDEGGRA